VPIPLPALEEEFPMSDDGFVAERDEIDAVLTVLEGLLRSVSIPVVRTCLEEARADVAHLTGRDATEGEDQPAVA
jgi:hypothetical protein